MTFNLFYDIGFDCEQVYDYDLWAPYSMVVSELTLTENTWDSLDKGMDVETHKQIWVQQLDLYVLRRNKALQTLYLRSWIYVNAIRNKKCQNVAATG